MIALKAMSGLKNELRKLETRHAKLQARIDLEMKRPMPDAMQLQVLKRMKLKTKDNIALISGVVRAVSKPSLPDAA